MKVIESRDLICRIKARSSTTQIIGFAHDAAPLGMTEYKGIASGTPEGAPRCETWLINNFAES
jgi:hypothetical protein